MAEQTEQKTTDSTMPANLGPLLATIQKTYPDNNASSDDVCPVCKGVVSWMWYAKAQKVTFKCKTPDCVEYSSVEA